MLDSRTRIVPPQSAAEWWRRSPRKPGVVTGYFDPLVAAHVRRLEEIAGAGGGLMVLVGSPEKPILPLAARAELVAALRMVECVVPCVGEEMAQVLAELGGTQVTREEAAIRSSGLEKTNLPSA